jgi:hypothetical protein
MSMEQAPCNQRPNEASPACLAAWYCAVAAWSQPGPMGCRWDCCTGRSGPGGLGGRPRRPPPKVQDSTGILAITATAHTLRAVLHGPAGRRRIQLDYRGAPGARCLIDGRPVSMDLPRDATGAMHLLGTLVSALGVTVTTLALLVKLDHAVAFEAALAVLDAARIAWPDVPHVACLGTHPDVDATMDDQLRALLRGSDDRAERILDYPRGHFARARERAKAKLTE